MSEHDIQNEIAETFRAASWIVIRVNSLKAKVFGRWQVAYRIFGLGKGSNSGFPDLLCLKQGQFRLVEVKKPGGQLKPSQHVFIEFAKRYGVNVHVIESTIQAEELL